MKIKRMVGAMAMIVGMIGSTVVAGAGSYAAVAVATTSLGVSSAQARSSVSISRSSSSRSSFSAPKPAPVVNNSSRGKAPVAVAPKPVSTPVPAKPATQSMIGSNVSKPKAVAAPTRVTRAPTRYSSTPPVNRTWHTNPVQRANNGSMIQPLLMGAAAGIGGAMLYDWLTAPSKSVTTTTTTAAPTNSPQDVAGAENHEGGLKVVKPTVNFKKFEGSEIPEKYQEVMKKQGLTIEPKKGDVTEYSKKLKMKDGVEINVDVAELPVLIVYVNEAGKPSEALFMPI